jgi:hypothetical protein
MMFLDRWQLRHGGYPLYPGESSTMPEPND